MSSGMNVKEAEKIADKMSYREAVMNCLYAKCVPYRKATKIKLNELLEIAENADKAYQQGRADEQLQSIEDAKEQAKEYRVALEEAKADGFQEALTSNGINIYVDKIESDGARKFAKWLCAKSDFETIDFKGMWNIEESGNQIFYSIDEVLAEWQEGITNE